jgi:hypothetical protein
MADINALVLGGAGLALNMLAELNLLLLVLMLTLLFVDFFGLAPFMLFRVSATAEDPWPEGFSGAFVKENGFT